VLFIDRREASAGPNRDDHFRRGKTWAISLGDVRGIVHDPQHRPVKGSDVSLRARASSYSQNGQTTTPGRARTHRSLSPDGVADRGQFRARRQANRPGLGPGGSDHRGSGRRWPRGRSIKQHNNITAEYLFIYVLRM